MDILTANDSNGALTWWRRQRTLDPTFKPIDVPHTAGPIAALFTLDFNLDEDQDIVLATVGSNAATALLVDPAALPQVEQSHMGFWGGEPVEIHKADFNGDGLLDATMLLRTLFFSQLDESLVLFTKTNLTSAPFLSARLIANLSNHEAMAVGDFNHDGAPDIAVTEFDADRGNDNIVIYFNQIPFFAGTFFERRVVGQSLGVAKMRAGDVDGDHDVDIVVLESSMTPFGVQALLNAGDGTLFERLPIGFPAGFSQSDQLELADLTGDSLLDIVISHGFGFDFDGFDFRSRVSYFTMTDRELLRFEEFEIAPTRSGVARIVVADLDGDGDNDVLQQQVGHFPRIVWWENTLMTPCRADITMDGDVNANDLAELLAEWGAGFGPNDLLLVLGSWGECPA